MPDVTLEDALREAYACAPADVRIVDTFQFTHPALQFIEGSVYMGGQYHFFLVNDMDDRTFTLETGVPVLFNKGSIRFQRPGKSNVGMQELALQMDNTDQRMSTFLEEARNFNEATEVRYRPYLMANPTTPQMIPPLLLSIRDAVITPAQITATATFADVINRTFPSELYTRTRFPGLGDN